METMPVSPVSISSLPTSEPTPFDAVFEGGGVKGIGHVGAYALLYERGYRVKNIVGTSAGAVVGTLIAAGYDTPAALESIFLRAPLESFPHEEWWESRLGAFGEGLELLSHKGVFDTSVFRDWFNDLLLAKNVRTFGDLIADANLPTDSVYRYRIQVVASDITRGRKLILPRDIPDYGIDPDRFPVLDAVAMSMSIPFYFQPYALEYSKDGVKQTNLIVDGGLLSDFPVDVLDSAPGEIPTWPTFGFKLVNPERERPHNTNGILSLASAVISTALEGNDAEFLEEAKFVRTIPIKTMGIQATDWNLTEQQRRVLYQSGRQAAEEFLTRWNFDAYKKLYRSSTPVPDRATRIRNRLSDALQPS